jgi:hypothetical protein
MMTKKIASSVKKLPSLNRTVGLEELKAGLPAAVATSGQSATRGSGQPVQVIMPADTLRAIKQAALDQDITVRAVILKALEKDGFPVPADDLRDRRKG